MSRCKYLLLSFALVVAVSCKKEKEKPDNQQVEIKEVVADKEPAKFTLVLTAKVLKDDRFRLNYAEDLKEQFSAKKIVFSAVKGNTEYQDISFELPKNDIYPSRLRLNFGTNKDQDPIDIKAIKIAHQGNEIEIVDSLFYRYFLPNKHMELDKSTGIVSFKEEDGKRAPFAISKRLLNTKLSEF